MSRRGIGVDLALGLWLLVASAFYLRQFAGPGLGMLSRLLGHR